jgi:hypothetical protein
MPQTNQTSPRQATFKVKLQRNKSTSRRRNDSAFDPFDQAKIILSSQKFVNTPFNKSPANNSCNVKSDQWPNGFRAKMISPVHNSLDIQNDL